MGPPAKPTQCPMTTELQTPIFLDEDARVLDWRIEELLRAGFPELLALELAATKCRVDVAHVQDLDRREAQVRPCLAQ